MIRTQPSGPLCLWQCLFQGMSISVLFTQGVKGSSNGDCFKAGEHQLCLPKVIMIEVVSDTGHADCFP